MALGHPGEHGGLFNHTGCWEDPQRGFLKTNSHRTQEATEQVDFWSEEQNCAGSPWLHYHKPTGQGILFLHQTGLPTQHTSTQHPGTQKNTQHKDKGLELNTGLLAMAKT